MARARVAVETDSPADAAIRRRSNAGLPPEMAADGAAILGAFVAYEAGDDDAARAALQVIGLKSPFLDWKLLLRGLLAYSVGDDSRAVENFARIEPGGLPGKMAAPVRAAIDPAFRESRPDAVALRATFEALAGGELLVHLKALRGELGRDKSMTAAWKYAAAAVPTVRARYRGAEAKLARAMYHALSKQGEPTDLPKYKKLFGDPPDDPDFDRLRAIALEDIGDVRQANVHWAKYEAWLAGPPTGWPPVEAARARAVLLHRMGANAAKAADRATATAMEGLFKVAPPKAPPDDFFRRSRDLAPDWPPAARALFDRQAGRDDAAAEATARTLLARVPDDLPTLERLAALCRRAGRADEALTLWRKAIAVNPLDKRLRAATAAACVAAARHALGTDAKRAATILTDDEPLWQDADPAAARAVLAAAYRKLRDPAAAEREEAAALAVPGARLAAAFCLGVDAVLAKLKPAEKKAAADRFTAELAAAVAPRDVNRLYAAYAAYPAAALDYRGRKAHEKKILDAVPRCLTADAPEADFEALAAGPAGRANAKLAETIATACEKRFPKNPQFKVALAESLAARRPGYAAERRILKLLDRAESLLDGRHEALAGRIAALRKRFAPADGLIEFLFGGRR